ncbi:flagellar hook-length control protein FliK [Alteromonas sp. S167]|uniref:flagellar hook-length control protein FliK n=1 Tax=Alteromonas sp. S167 TaxID=3117402 RepID=UPI002FDF1A85
MQQVAAQKTDLAALPFAASSTAKAVSDGVGAGQGKDGGRSFEQFYEEAKGSNPDFIPKQATPAKSEASHNNQTSNKLLNENQASHRDVPMKKGESIELPADEKSYDQELPEEASMQEDAEYAQNVSEQNESVPKPTLSDKNGRADNDAISNPLKGEITTPGIPDDELHGDRKSDTDNDGNDWIAFVDSIVNKAINNEADLASNTRGIEITQKETGKLWKLPDNVDSNSAESVLNHLLTQLKENEGLENTDTVSNTDIIAAVKSLSALLKKGASDGIASGKGDGEIDVYREFQGIKGEDAQGELSAILNGSQSGLSSDGDFENNNPESSDSLQQLIAKLVNNSDEDEIDVTQSESAIADNNLKDAIDKLNPEELSAEETLVLNIVQDQLNKAISAEGELQQSNNAQPNQAELTTLLEGELSEQELAHTVTENSTVTTGISANNAEQTTGNQSENAGAQVAQANAQAVENDATSLLNTIAEMPLQTAQKAAEAFAEQIAGAVPNAQQQQAVKANIIAGINEFQQQVQQGREPGIDLSAIVADAAKEAQLSSDVAASLTAKVDTQASQFLQLVNNAQSTAAQVLQAQFTQTDTVMNENNQLRSEASKTQQQFEGFDKAVNIHKPEGQQQLNEKIRWMVNARNTMAEIRLDPPELGSMQVRVNVSGDAASVSFVVQSQQAKEALAEAMPRLRDMLSEQGIELGDAQVRKDNSSGNESGQQFANNSSASTGDQNSANSDGMNESAVIEQSITREMKGGIDYYA